MSPVLLSLSDHKYKLLPPENTHTQKTKSFLNQKMELTNVDFVKIQEQILLEKLSEIIPIELMEDKDEKTAETAILKAATSYIRLLEKIIEAES